MCMPVVDRFAVEGIGAPDAKGIAPGAGAEETDSVWQPI